MWIHKIWVTPHCFLCDFHHWQLSWSAITEGLHLTVKWKKCVWRPGSTRTRWGAYSAPPDPLAGFKGSYFKGRGRKGRGRGEGERERGERRKGRKGGKGRRKGERGGERDLAPRKKSWRHHWLQGTLVVRPLQEKWRHVWGSKVSVLGCRQNWNE